MKKLLIANLIIAIINLSITVLVVVNYCRPRELHGINVTDTAINKVQIDSILLIINRKDSTIYDIKKKIKYEQDKADSLNNNDAYKLFEQLVSE